jgi:GGDEF domain-containing protein
LPEQPEAQFSRAQLTLLHLDARFGRVVLIAAITAAVAAGSILLTLALIAAFFGLAAAWSSWAYVMIPLICVVAIAPAMLGYVLGLLDTLTKISEDYRRLAEVDQLTGALNRRGLFDRATDLPGGTTVVLADIDHFKSVNDLGGHIAGDRALVEVAAALTRLGGPDALLARTGGDEFVLLVPPSSNRELVTSLRVPVPRSAGERDPGMVDAPRRRRPRRVDGVGRRRDVRRQTPRRLTAPADDSTTDGPADASTTGGPG